jgi:hypothetical protein
MGSMPIVVIGRGRARVIGGRHETIASFNLRG